MASKIKRGDTVIVLTGRERGRQGEVLKIDRDRQRVLVRGLNMVSRHTKPSRTNAEGGIVRQEALMALSNVALLDPADNKPVRVGFRIEDDGRKVRIARRSGTVIN